MSALTIHPKMLAAFPSLLSRIGKYGFLLFFLKGLLWLLGPWVIYAFH